MRDLHNFRLSAETETMAQVPLDDILLAVDQHIKEGALSKARSLLKSIKPKKVPRDSILSLAQLSRRAQIPRLGLKLLSSIVRSEKVLLKPASAAELALYAALLAQAGVRREAREILETLSQKPEPEISFYWLYVLLPEWNYQEAIPHIKKYLRSREISQYQRMVGTINLIACYIYVRDTSQALRSLKKMYGYLEKTPSPLLEKNYWELKSQAALQQHHYQEALSCLDKIKTSEASDIYSLYIEKWKYLVSLKEGGPWQSSQFLKLKQLAKDLKDWETLRDLDLQTGLYLKDAKMIHYSYFGSGYPAYRRAIRQQYNEVSYPRKYRIDLHQRRETKEKIYFSLQTGESSDGRIKLKVGQSLHRCLCALLSDFYRPKSMDELFSDLFPNEYFNPNTSTQRVSQLVYRLNHWLEKKGVPLFFESINYQYHLRTKTSFAVEFEETPEALTQSSFRREQAQNLIGESRFTAKGLVQLLDVSVRSAQNLCREWIRDGSVIKKGKGPSTFYYFNVSTIKNRIVRNRMAIKNSKVG